MAAPSSSRSPSPVAHPESAGPARVTAAERAYKGEMMFLGERCHLSDCHRESFLPFRCQDCQHQFCSDHYKTGDHSCTDASATFLVPLCPLCHEPPKNWKRDEDPNLAMNAHLTPHRTTGRIECTALDEQGIVKENAKGRPRREKRENECNDRKCRKLMVVPIRCPSCSLHFCPSHRAPVQHSCASLTAASAPPQSKVSGKRSKLLNASPAPPPSSPPTEKGKSSKQEKGREAVMKPLQAIGAAHNGLKTDKRARSEHASAIKAMQARHAKGLLSQAEQVRLAEEMALMKDKKENRDCVVV